MFHPGVALLQMQGIHKSFPGVHALRGADLQLARGEVLAIVGENGAGKSTLIKILAGAVQPDAGAIQLNGQPAIFRGPFAAARAGISVIYQEFNLVPTLTVRENIFLGREGSFIGRHRRERKEAAALFSRLGVSIDPDVRCRDLTVAQQQLVEIAKALSMDASILVMDEPTAALTPQEAERLFKLVRELKHQGLGIIYISHRLEEIFAIADRVMVLRDGQHVATQPVAQVTRKELIELMVGRKIEQEFPARSGFWSAVAERSGDTALHSSALSGRTSQSGVAASLCHRTPKLSSPRFIVENLSRGKEVRNVSFAIHRGEVLGLTGLAGAGRTETVRLIFGADARDSGRIVLDGHELIIRNPRQAIRAGVALLTEDRKAQGLILNQSVRQNFGLPNLRQFSRWGFVRRNRERSAFSRLAGSLAIKLHTPEQRVRTLSGGNQQKVILAKWLQRNCEVIIFDEPTRGIDVGGKYEVYQLINQLAEQGKCILVVSSEFAEVLGICDRVLVMHQGRITGEIENPKSATPQDILHLALGNVAMRNDE